MGDYFNPVRRKLGILTLMLACWFAAGWIHSRTHDDILNVPVGYTFYQVRSTTGKILLCCAHSTDSAKNQLDHYPELILLSGKELIIAGTKRPATIHWQSMTHSRSKSSRLSFQFEDLSHDPEMKVSSFFGIKRFGKIRSFVENPTRGFLKTDETVRIIDELVIYVLAYWTIVIPLTLLSAWLLLSKPKPKSPPMQI